MQLPDNKKRTDEFVKVVEVYLESIRQGQQQGDVSVMCNLSQGIKEDGIAIGKELGKEIGKAIGEAGIIINMHNNGFTAQQIADATNKDLKDVQAIIEGKELMTV